MEHADDATPPPTGGRPGSGVAREPRPTAATLLILPLVALHLAFSLFVNPAGYLTYDSGTYHYMAETFASTGGFIVDNGYSELPSPELEVAHLRISGDKIVSKFPELLSIAAYPFYKIFAYRGLFLLNALAFIAINFLIFKLTQLIFESRRTAWLAVLIYSFGTYAWEYSQSSYPHLSSTFLILLGFYFSTGARQEPPSPKSLRWAFAAGLAAGFAPGLRLDSALAIPALILPFLFTNSIRYREISALIAGLSPGFLFLSLTNYVKFQTYLPLSYGVEGTSSVADFQRYLPFALFACAVLAFAILWSRFSQKLRAKAGLLLAILGVVFVAYFHDTVWRYSYLMLNGAYQLLVDLRIRSFDIPEASLLRTQSGALVYMGGVKKSLLQSCPHLILLLFTLADVILRRERYRDLAALFLVPLGFIGIYSYMGGWHGSLPLNLRYFNPALPFLAILAAHAWGKLSWRLLQRGLIWCAGPLFLALFFLFLPIRGLLLQELLFLTVPLLLASFLALAELGRRMITDPGRWQTAVCLLLLIAFAWSGAMAFGRDYVTSSGLRRSQLIITEQLTPMVLDDSLIYSDVLDLCWGLIGNVEDVRIAYPSKDQGETFHDLARYHLRENHHVYLLFTSGFYAHLQELGFLERYELGLMRAWGTSQRPSLFLFKVAASSEDDGPLVLPGQT